MRSGYAALVLGSLVLQKDLSGRPSVRSRTAQEADGKDGPIGFCPEGNLLSQFQHMLCSQGFCWISETTWGFPLAFAVLLLLWLGFELWTSCCLARWQAQRRQPAATESHAAQPSPPPLPEAEGEEEAESPATQAKHSSCICGRPPTPDFESYELPCQVHRHPCEPYQTPRSVRQEDNYQKYLPCLPPPLLRSTVILSKHSSSSSSSSRSSSCLPLLKHLNLCCRVATDVSWTRHDSSETSEASSSDSSSLESDDLYFLKKRKPRGPSFIPLFPERLPEINGAPLLLPESHPEMKGVPQTSFAQINIVQSSTFDKDDHVILVEKSLEIRMGPLLAPGCLPGLRMGGQEDAGEKPPPLPLLDQMAVQCLDFRVKEQTEELAQPREKSAPEASPEEEEEPTRPKVTAEPAAGGALPPRGSEEVPAVLQGMDEKSRDVLEFHIKKKMVQRRCGVPTVVINSLNLFQPVGKKSFRGDLKRTMQSVLLIPSDVPEAAAPPALPPRNAMAIYMNSLREPLRAKGGHIFHKANPEEIRAAGFPPPEEKLGLKPRDSQGSQRNEVLSSVEPEKLRKLLFHLTVKMVEIRKGAFPEMLEASLRTFSILSVKPLPKPIRFGNKIPRPKHLSLSFVAKEALCIIDFNISHKFMVFTWGIPTPPSKPMEKASPGLSKATQCPRSPEKGVPPKPPVPILVLKTPRKGPSTPGGPESKQFLLIPKPQGLRRAPPAPAEEPQVVQFRDLFKQSTLAPSALSTKAEWRPARALALPLREAPTQETEAPGDGIQPKKAALAVPCPKSQAAAAKGSPSTKPEAPGDGTTRTLEAANLQEELQDGPTGLPAPLKGGAKAGGKEAGSKKVGEQQGEPEGLLPYRALPPAFKTEGAGSKKEADKQAEPYRALSGGEERGELEGTMHYTSPGTGTGSKTGDNQQAELEGSLHYRALPAPSTQKGASKSGGDERGELEGTMRYTSPGTGTGSKTGDNQQAELEGSLHYRAFPAPSTQKGASKSGGDERGELEGTMRFGAPSETPKKGSPRAAERRAELEGSLRYAATGAGTGKEKGGQDQAGLEGALHYRAAPPAAQKKASDGHRPAESEGATRGSAPPQPAAEGAGSAQRSPARRSEAGAPSRGQADGEGGRISRKSRERAPRGDALALSLGLQAAGSRRGASPTRAGLFLRLHLSGQRLHLHLQKRLEAALGARQRAGLSVRVEAGGGERRGPFCYACPAADRRGAAGKTVCWTLPQRILDRNGGRVPQVARRERRPRQTPARPAGRRRPSKPFA